MKWAKTLAKSAHNKALVRMQTTLRFVCTAQLGRYAYVVQ
jgi:hypothetical protein